jgi:hypothetical protein
MKNSTKKKSRIDIASDGCGDKGINQVIDHYVSAENRIL